MKKILTVLGSLCMSGVLLSSVMCSPSHAASKTVTWNPLEKQEREPDTLFLLDMNEEAKLKSGEGGLIAGNEAGGRKLSDDVATIDGKFRPGLKSITPDYGYAWMPANGLISPDEWTVEYWLKSDVPTETMQDKIPLVIYDEHGAFYLECVFQTGHLNLNFRHNQTAGAPVDVRMSYDLNAHPLAAGVWHNIAYTFKAGTLRFYVNGEFAGETKDIPTPRIYNDASRGDGLSIGGGYGRGGVGLAVSDLRISRFARTPGEKITVSDDNILTVSTEPTGAQVNQNLRGGLHYFADDKTDAMGKGLLQVMRTDKLLTATPIVAGAPDATHPSQGVSGKYSYDWQVVDRTFDYYKKIGVMPYISIDSTPEILGGKTPPFSGEQLKTLRSGASGFSPELPNDMAAFSAIVRDLVNHVIKERGDKVPYWAVWNEPDGDFLTRKVEDYIQVYDACAAAVKAVDPNLKIGGPETASFNPVWTEALVKHCAETKTPLDFVSWHYYLGDLNEFTFVKKQVGAWSAQYGLPNTPGLINGEWTWQANNLYGTGYAPFNKFHYHINDWNAAFMGASLVEMQRAGVLLSIFTNPVSLEAGTSWDSSGLMSFEHHWATGNVFQLWSKLAPDILTSEYSGIPDVWSLASRDKAGRITILLSHLRYRKDVSPQITIRLNGAAAKQKYKVTSYVVDDAHSNAIDAGAEHAELETVAAPQIKNGELQITMRPRAVDLLVLEPQK